MKENQSNQSSENASDDIDLGHLFRLIGKGFDRLFRGILRIFVYLKRNALWLAGILVLGVLVGLGLKQLSGTKLKLDVIVTPNFQTKNYLNDVVAQIRADLESEDKTFLTSLGLSDQQAEKFEIEIIPLRNQDETSLAEEMAFLELFKELGDSPAVTEILREELEEKTTRDQRITFYFKDAATGEANARAILDYINSNEYYGRLNQVYTENARLRIKRNDSLIKQIDILINNYTQQMVKEQAAAEGRLILENQETLDIPSLFALKNQLIRDTETKKLELESIDEPITIVNMGRPHQVEVPFFGKKLVFVPLLFIGIFFLFSLLKHLNREARRREIS